jgi:hypothetical protein
MSVPPPSVRQLSRAASLKRKKEEKQEPNKVVGIPRRKPFPSGPSYKKIPTKPELT